MDKKGTVWGLVLQLRFIQLNGTELQYQIQPIEKCGTVSMGEKKKSYNPFNTSV